MLYLVRYYRQLPTQLMVFFLVNKALKLLCFINQFFLFKSAYSVGLNQSSRFHLQTLGEEGSCREDDEDEELNVRAEESDSGSGLDTPRCRRDRTDQPPSLDPSAFVLVVDCRKGLRKKRKITDEIADVGTKAVNGKAKKPKKASPMCDICRESFPDRTLLRQHVKTKHIDESGSFICDFCFKTFKTKPILKGHRQKHVSEPQFLCVRCGKKYFTVSNLNEHSLYCMDEKRFECSICGKKFSVNKQFKRHMVIHESHRYIKCSVCEMTFSRKDNYRQHFRRHTGEKPFTCDVCGKSFRIKATYNYHRKTHRPDEPPLRHDPPLLGYP